MCSLCTSLSYIAIYESHAEGSTLLILCCAKFALSVIFGIFSIEMASCHNSSGTEARTNTLNVSLQRSGLKFFSLEADGSNHLLDADNDRDHDPGLLDISIDETTRRERRPSSFDIPSAHHGDTESEIVN